MSRVLRQVLQEMPVLGDGPLGEAARLMGLQPREFERLLPQYLARGFPSPDELSGLFDLDAVLEWRRRRFPEVYGLTDAAGARDARGLVQQRIAGLARAGHKAAG